jgi:hypothetical protein
VTPVTATSQLVLRTLALLGPVVALLATGPAGHWPPWWLVGPVVLLAAAFAAMPDSPFGAAVFLAVVVWWTISLPDSGQPEVLLAATALVVSHVAALLASYGPGAMRVDPATLRLWVRRGLLVLLTVPAAWGGARLLRGEPEQPGIWILGVVAALAATVAATVALGTGRPGGAHR